jgi:hypothetical protein
VSSGLRFGSLKRAINLCIDMQTLFAERTDWHLPWLERVLPRVTRLAKPTLTIQFSRALSLRTDRRMRWAVGGATMSTGLK